jgi:hypothetical protein
MSSEFPGPAGLPLDGAAGLPLAGVVEGPGDGYPAAMADPVEHDLELTTSALKAGPTDLGIAGGLLEVRRWQDHIDGDHSPALEEIGAALAELRGELESDAPDSTVLSDLMRRLGRMTLEVAADQPAGEMRSRLQDLGHLLARAAAEAD